MVNTVKRPGQPPKEVRNLGWLYRVTRRNGGMRVEKMTARKYGEDGAMLKVYMTCGTTYTSEFACRKVLCVEFLQLPRWRRYPKTFIGMNADGDKNVRT